MFKLLLISAFVVAVYAAPLASHLDGRIVGGIETSIEEYPYQLSLLYHGTHICGATIIAEKIAITAAHCTDGTSTSEFTIRAGSSTLGSGGQTIKVSKIHQNPAFNSSSMDYDISVLELLLPIRLGENAQKIALDPKNIGPTGGENAMITGWGNTSEGGSLSSTLRVANVEIVKFGVCHDAYGWEKITDRMICAVSRAGGRDTCQGDSGGPLVVNNKLAGVVSWGYGCARPEDPRVYSNIAVLRDFIDKIVGL